MVKKSQELSQNTKQRLKIRSNALKLRSNGPKLRSNGPIAAMFLVAQPVAEPGTTGLQRPAEIPTNMSGKPRIAAQAGREAVTNPVTETSPSLHVNHLVLRPRQKKATMRKRLR